MILAVVWDVSETGYVNDSGTVVSGSGSDTGGKKCE